MRSIKYITHSVYCLYVSSDRSERKLIKQKTKQCMSKMNEPHNYVL